MFSIHSRIADALRSLRSLGMRGWHKPGREGRQSGAATREEAACRRWTVATGAR
jgi:hypothetical protein